MSLFISLFKAKPEISHGLAQRRFLHCYTFLPSDYRPWVRSFCRHSSSSLSFCCSASKLPWDFCSSEFCLGSLGFSDQSNMDVRKNTLYAMPTCAQHHCHCLSLSLFEGLLNLHMSQDKLRLNICIEALQTASTIINRRCTIELSRSHELVTLESVCGGVPFFSRLRAGPSVFFPPFSSPWARSHADTKWLKQIEEPAKQALSQHESTHLLGFNLLHFLLESFFSFGLLLPDIGVASNSACRGQGQSYSTVVTMAKPSAQTHQVEWPNGLSLFTAL